jgi:hypothetical protein
VLPVLADAVEKVRFEVVASAGLTVAMALVVGATRHAAEVGAGAGISMASLRRFWAVAARRNSSCAPFGPRNRNRSSLRMRLRWANSISTFFYELLRSSPTIEYEKNGLSLPGRSTCLR